MLNRTFTLLIIIALSLNLSYGSPRIRNKIAKPRADDLNYKLTENVFPTHYTIKLSPRLSNKTFTGYIKILIHVKVPTNNITLHQTDLNITKEKIYLTTKDDLVINIKDAGNSGTVQQEFYTITFSQILNESTYFLHIPEFYGYLNGNRRGFYYVNYTDENGKSCEFATTFFESMYARYAFPCFDEPFFRAKFKIYMIRPSNYHSLSNSNLIKSISLNNSLYEDEFEDTKSMPTYLVTFIVSDMKLSKSRGSDFYRILARREMLDKSYEKYSANLSAKILQGLETYFNVNYSLNKMDQVAIPDKFFAASGMENWGLIIYKESKFLVTPETTTNEKFEIATVVAHELVHQWFGNLVTVKWWRYLWLKEGFTQFVEHRILDEIKPEWKEMERFIAIEKHDVLQKDSAYINRNMNQDAGTRSEISDLYDYISYEKAACVIHMFETIMTPNVFRQGLTNYLQDRAFQSAVPTDVYRNFQKALDKSAIKLPQNLNIGEIMATWDSQEGYPLVYVKRDYEKHQEVKLSQSRYVDYNFDKVKQTTWYIPINYATKSDPNFNDTRFSTWLLKPNGTITVNNLKRDDWLILNKQEAYYYRVNYDVRNWKLIAKGLKENYKQVHKLNRAQILDDSFNLAQLEQLDYSIPLEIASYVHQEDDYIIHIVFLRYIVNIEEITLGTDVDEKLQNYVIRSLKRSYKRLGDNPRATDTEIDKLHRIEVVRWMCKFNYAECRANAWKTFDQWRKNNKSIVEDLKKDIMCNAIRYGSEDDWNYLYKKYESSSSYDFQSTVINWLACTENASILQHFLDSSLNSSTKYSIGDVMRLINFRGLAGLNASKYYMTEHFNDLQIKFGNLLIVNYLSAIFPHFKTEAQLDEFMELLPKNITNDHKIDAVLTGARYRISENQKRRLQISKFFQSYDTHQFRSDGNLCHVIPNTFIFILYSVIMFVIVRL